MNDDLWNLDARAQAQLVLRGDVAPLELVDAAIERIEALEPRLHALACADFERARARARDRPQGPLGGVPFLVKDLIAYPGLRHAMGSRVFAANVASEATAYSRRLDEAGLVVLGKTTTSEFGLLGSTETLLEGTTHNPWNTGCSAGGSSGGSAAAVASRMVPMAHASDGGGSIRGPASINGVFGFKPGRGRVVPTAPDDMAGLLADHAVSISVADSALLLALTEDTTSSLPPIGFVSRKATRRLRIGCYTETPSGEQPSTGVRAAFERTRELCDALGHTTVDAPPPPIDGERLGGAFFTLAGKAMEGLCDMLAGVLGRPLDERDLEPFTLELVAWSRTLPADAAPRAQAAIEELGATIRRYLEGHDVMLCPTIPVEPWALGTLAPILPRETILPRMQTMAGYTAVHNFAGTPAMSVPLGMSERGLPIGSHFAAPRGAEATLLQLAYELEEAAPWRARRPP